MTWFFKSALSTDFSGNWERLDSRKCVHLKKKKRVGGRGNYLEVRMILYHIKKASWPATPTENQNPDYAIEKNYFQYRVTFRVIQNSQFNYCLPKINKNFIAVISMLHMWIVFVIDSYKNIYRCYTFLTAGL